MIDRATKLRWRRKVKQRQRQIEGISSSTEEHFDKHFFRRLGRLYEVRRFILTWVLLVVALIGGVVIQTRALGDYFLKLVPVSGGIYSEGLIGSYTNANPIFASSDVDTTVSKLLFSGLLTYDHENQLTGDIAEDWSVDEAGKTYTVRLRQDVKWHDGRNLTANDVAFTVRAIQNPDTRSPYFSAWQGIKTNVVNDHEIQFVLPNVLASFPYSLTLGILPRHKLEGVPFADLRGSLFNTVEPVGSGPFRWKDVEVVGNTAEEREQRIALSRFGDYYRGRPHIEEYIVRAFLNEEALIGRFDQGRLNAVAGGLSVPLTGKDVQEHIISLNGAVMVFFNTQSEPMNDAKLRRALTQATNQDSLLKQLGQAEAVHGPLLPEHVGFSKDYLQHKFNQAAATKLLDEAGWQVDAATGIRQKDGKKLSLGLKTLNSAEYAMVANQLQKQWSEIGVELSVESLAQNDLQNHIDERSYDALVHGIIMGSDADQFAYWHGSQADVLSQRRLNFSDYRSDVADSALEAGRTRIDPELRAAKYTPFLEVWRNDSPAIALYKPRFVYTVYGQLYNFDFDSINSPVDRLNNVHEWMIRTDRAIID